MAYDFIYLLTRKWKSVIPFGWNHSGEKRLVAMHQPATEEGLTQNSWAVGCLFLAHATSLWALTHPFPDSPVLSFHPVLCGLTGMFWVIFMYQGSALLQTWFFFLFFVGVGVVYRCSPMFLKSPLIHSKIHYEFYAALLIRSSNKASPRHDASSHQTEGHYSRSPGPAVLLRLALMFLLLCHSSHETQPLSLYRNALPQQQFSRRLLQVPWWHLRDLGVFS